MPDAHGVNDKDVTSPQTYLVFFTAVIVGDVPLTVDVTNSPDAPYGPVSPLSPLSPLMDGMFTQRLSSLLIFNILNGYSPPF